MGDKDDHKLVEKQALYIPSKLKGAWGDTIFFKNKNILQTISLNEKSEV